MITCCKNCTSRHRACHDTCNVYLLEKGQAEQGKEAMRKAKDADQFNYMVRHNGYLAKYDKGNFRCAMKGLAI